MSRCIEVRFFLSPSSRKQRGWVVTFHKTQHPGCGPAQGSQKYSFPINASIIDANAPGCVYLLICIIVFSSKTGSTEFDWCLQHLGDTKIVNLQQKLNRFSGRTLGPNPGQMHDSYSLEPKRLPNIWFSSRYLDPKNKANTEASKV